MNLGLNSGWGHDPAVRWGDIMFNIELLPWNVCRGDQYSGAYPCPALYFTLQQVGVHAHADSAKSNSSSLRRLKRQDSEHTNGYSSCSFSPSSLRSSCSSSSLSPSSYSEVTMYAFLI